PAGGRASRSRPCPRVAAPCGRTPLAGGLAVANHLYIQIACMWPPLPRRQRLLSLPIAATSDCSHHLIFSSLPLCKSCEIILEEFRYRDPSLKVERRGRQPRLAPMQGWPPTARPRARPLARGRLAAAKASLQGRPAPLVGAAARRGDSRPRAHPLAVRHPQRGPAVGRPQGATAHGQPYRQQGQRHRPQGWLPLGRVVADGQE
ncbi:hypothetical protein B296_00048573, partial [Ensete ventricosum]